MKEKKKRGPGRPDKPPPIFPSDLDLNAQIKVADKEVKERARCYVAESIDRKKSLTEQARWDLAYNAALLQRRLWRMHMREELNQLKAEEVRALASMHREYNRIMLQLGLNADSPLDDEPPPM